MPCTRGLVLRIRGGCDNVQVSENVQGEFAIYGLTMKTCKNHKMQINQILLERIRAASLKGNEHILTRLCAKDLPGDHHHDLDLHHSHKAIHATIELVSRPLRARNQQGIKGRENW